MPLIRGVLGRFFGDRTSQKTGTLRKVYFSYGEWERGCNLMEVILWPYQVLHFGFIFWGVMINLKNKKR